MLLVYHAEQGNTHVVMPKILSSFFGRVVDLGKRGCKQVRPKKLSDIPRSTLLRLHGYGLNIYYQFHQHSSRDQWTRSITNHCNLGIRDLERPIVSVVAIHPAAWEVSSLRVLWCSLGRGTAPSQPLLYDPSLCCVSGIRVPQLAGHSPIMSGSHIYALSQVSGSSLPWRHVLLFFGNGLCGRGHFRAL